MAPLLSVSRISQRPLPMVPFNWSLDMEPITLIGKSLRILPKHVRASTL